MWFWRCVFWGTFSSGTGVRGQGVTASPLRLDVSLEFLPPHPEPPILLGTGPCEPPILQGGGFPVPLWSPACACSPLAGAQPSSPHSLHPTPLGTSCPLPGAQKDASPSACPLLLPTASGICSGDRGSPQESTMGGGRGSPQLPHPSNTPMCFFSLPPSLWVPPGTVAGAQHRSVLLSIQPVLGTPLPPGSPPRRGHKPANFPVATSFFPEDPPRSVFCSGDYVQLLLALALPATCWLTCRLLRRARDGGTCPGTEQNRRYLVQQVPWGHPRCRGTCHPRR